MRPGWMLAAAAAAAAVALGASFERAGAPTSPNTGVVAVETKLGFESAEAAGTGIVLPAGGILTNNHVIRGATAVAVVVPRTRRRFVARVVGYAVAADVALLQIKGKPRLQTAPLGHSAGLTVGDRVRAVGNAGGTGLLTTTAGSVTGLGRSIMASDDQGASERLTGLIETSAALRPGDSGGPLEDRSGRVIGIDTAASHGFVFSSSTGRGFAIPIDRALSVTRQIAAGRSSGLVHIGPTAFLGVQLARSGNVHGGLVEAVVGASPAERAGLGPGDVITSLAGRTVGSAKALVAILLRLEPEQVVALRWTDDGGTVHHGTITPTSGPPQ